jgi:DNA-binding MarR family transcriptional regulator
MDEELLAIQRFYPQVFHACHVRHVRSRTNAWRVSERDQSLLAHLSLAEGTRPSELARHFGVGLPTLSEAVGRLERLGYVERGRAASDKRARSLRLTPTGAEALMGTSVLDTDRLRALLRRLSPRERQSAVRGLELLAGAARAMQADERGQRKVERRKGSTEGKR